MPAMSIPKDNARKAGRKSYNDVSCPCSKCGGTMRYVANGACVECIRVANRKTEKTDAGKAANRERQARYRASKLAEKVAKENAFFDDI